MLKIFWLKKKLISKIIVRNKYIIFIFEIIISFIFLKLKKILFEYFVENGTKIKYIF